MRQRKRIYVAGPISQGSVADNVARATRVGRELIRRGFAPLVPQLSCFMGFDAYGGYEYPVAEAGGIEHAEWLAADLPWVAVADAVLRLPGESIGADEETAWAEENGVPVFAGATDDLGVEAVCNYFAPKPEPVAPEPVGEKTPWPSEFRKGWYLWFSIGRYFDVDDPNILPADVFAALPVMTGDKNAFVATYPTRQAAIDAYNAALMMLAAEVPTTPEPSPTQRGFVTGSMRDSRDGKGRFDLLPPAALRRLAQHFETGAKKYGDRNWEKGQPLQSYIDSALRHVFNHQEGMRDEDHLIAAAWNLLAYVETEHRIRGSDLPETLDDFPYEFTAARWKIA